MIIVSASPIISQHTRPPLLTLQRHGLRQFLRDYNQFGVLLLECIAGAKTNEELVYVISMHTILYHNSQIQHQNFHSYVPCFFLNCLSTSLLLPFALSNEISDLLVSILLRSIRCRFHLVIPLRP